MMNLERNFIVQNITTLLYPHQIFYIERTEIKNFFQGLLCPNNIENEYGSVNSASEK